MMVEISMCYLLFTGLCVLWTIYCAFRAGWHLHGIWKLNEEIRELEKPRVSGRTPMDPNQVKPDPPPPPPRRRGPVPSIPDPGQKL